MDAPDASPHSRAAVCTTIYSPCLRDETHKPISRSLHLLPHLSSQTALTTTWLSLTPSPSIWSAPLLCHAWRALRSAQVCIKLIIELCIVHYAQAHVVTSTLQGRSWKTHPDHLAGGCFGAVVVNAEGKIIGEGVNNVVGNSDPTGCAPIHAITPVDA
jgi:hypothetical protein